MAKTAFESRQLKKASKPFRSLGQRLNKLFPQLNWTLERADMDVDAVTYLSITLYMSISSGIAVFFGLLLPNQMVGRTLMEGLPWRLYSGSGLPCS